MSLLTVGNVNSSIKTFEKTEAQSPISSQAENLNQACNIDVDCNQIASDTDSNVDEIAKYFEVFQESDESQDEDKINYINDILNSAAFAEYHEPEINEPSPCTLEEPSPYAPEEPLPCTPEAPSPCESEDNHIENTGIEDVPPTISSESENNEQKLPASVLGLIKTGSKELENALKNAGLFGTTKKGEVLEIAKKYITEESVAGIIDNFGCKNEKDLISTILDSAKIGKNETAEILKHITGCLSGYLEKDGVCIDDLQEELNMQLDKTFLSKSAVENTMKKIISRATRRNKEDDEANGMIDKDFSQGQVGDCWLLSSIHAIANTPNGLKILNDSLEVLEDGSVKVNLKGANKEYVISKDELERKDEYSSGDMDVRAIEIAMEKYLEENGYRIKVVNNIETIEMGGLSSIAFNLLTSKSDTSFFEGTLYEYMFDKMGLVVNQNFINKVKDPNIACTASISFGQSHTTKTASGDEIELPGQHAYSIVDADDEYVYVVNPWDTSKTITLTHKEFKKVFDAAGYVDLN